MKKITLSAALLLAAMSLQAQAWAEKWEWPLAAEYQIYTSGETVPSSASVGGVDWYLKNSKKPTDKTDTMVLTDPRPVVDPKKN